MPQITTTPLPVRISSSPLISANVEFKFSTEMPKNEFFNLVVSIVREEYPNLLPPIQHSNPGITFLTSRDEGRILALGNNIIGYESANERYGSWKEFVFGLERLMNTLIAAKLPILLDSIRLRYLNIIENVPLAQAISANILFQVEGYTSHLQVYDFILRKENVITQVQLAGEAGYNTSNGKSGSGILIEINSVASIPGTVLTLDLLPVIDSMHTTEKQIFFSVLNPNFVETLNPIYE